MQVNRRLDPHRPEVAAQLAVLKEWLLGTHRAQLEVQARQEALQLTGLRQRLQKRPGETQSSP